MRADSHRDAEFPVTAEQVVASWKAFNAALRLLNEALGVQPASSPRPQLRVLEGGVGRSSP